MKTGCKVASMWSLLLSVIVLSTSLCAQARGERTIRVTLVGFADRWADYGSRGDMPGFRDFVAVLHESRPGGASHDSFIKIRFLYWREGKSDPKSFSEGEQQRRVIEAKRDVSCDETFGTLSREGEISYLDPQLKPSRFVHMKGRFSKLPPPQMRLPCYEVKQ